MDLEANNAHGHINSKTSLRMAYEAEAKVIQDRIGDLVSIQNRLDLSARKICQLLMVDPSAWNRWTQGKTPPPPHIIRSLEWYLLLTEKYPGLSVQHFLPTKTQGNSLKIQEEFSSQLQSLNLELKKSKRLMLALTISQGISLFIIGAIIVLTV